MKAHEPTLPFTGTISFVPDTAVCPCGFSHESLRRVLDRHLTTIGRWDGDLLNHRYRNEGRSETMKAIKSVEDHLSGQCRGLRSS